MIIIERLVSVPYAALYKNPYCSLGNLVDTGLIVTGAFRLAIPVPTCARARVDCRYVMSDFDIVAMNA